MLDRKIKTDKRQKARAYAENLYPGQKVWIDIAEKAFRDGEDNAIFVMRKSDYKKLYSELQELRDYKKDMEETLNDPQRLADLIGGL